MATYGEILAKLTGRMDSVPDEYVAAVNRVQDDVLRRILPLLDRMVLDETGAVVANSENYAIAARIEEELPRILRQSGMADAIKNFATGLDEQRALTDSLYETILDSPKFRDLLPMWNASRNMAVDLSGSGVVNVYSSQLTQAVNNAIGSGSSFTEVISTVRNTTTGTAEVDGVLYRYAKQQSKDAFATASRKYAEQVNRKYGIEFYRYTGGLKDTSREFCEERKGKYYHKKEVESWAGSDWAGKARNTNKATIFTLVGGYNCAHYLAPVPIDKVPVEVLRDALDKGFIKEEDLPRRVSEKMGLEMVNDE